MDDNIAKLNVVLLELHQESMMPAEVTQELWMNTRKCRSDFHKNEKSAKALFVESISHLVYTTIHN